MALKLFTTTGGGVCLRSETDAVTGLFTGRVALAAEAPAVKMSTAAAMKLFFMMLNFSGE